MTIWLAEINELKALYDSLKGQLTGLEKELERLVKTDDENMVLVYARRCLEVIITDLCENELKRSRGTEPLKGIIDKLNKEELVPSHIITSMHNLNSLSTYGAHPKEFDLQQVRPVIINLLTVIKWYLSYKNLEVKVQTVKPVQPEESKPEATIPARKTKKQVALVSGILFIAILAVLLFNVFNIFSKDKFESVREEDGRISVAVMPFENQTGDTTLNYFQRGISSIIINGLGSSSQLAVRDDHTMYEAIKSEDKFLTAGFSGTMARDIAEKVQSETFLTGSFQGSGNNYLIMVNLVDTESGNVLWTNKVEGDLKSSDYMDLAYSLCNNIKEYLEIKAIEQETDYDFRKVYPKSAEAFKYFTQGMNSILALDYETGIAYLKQSLAIDSTFTYAAFYLAYAYGYNYDDELRNEWTRKAYDLKDNLPMNQRYWLELWNACYFEKSLPDIIRFCNLLEASELDSRILWFDLGVSYYDFTNQFQKAVHAFEKIEKINAQKGDWYYEEYYVWYGKALHEVGNYEKEKEIYEKGLTLVPESYDIMVQNAKYYLSQGNTDEANGCLEKLRTMMPRMGYSDIQIDLILGVIHYEADIIDAAVSYLRKVYNYDKQDPSAIFFLSDMLIKKDVDINEGMQLIEKGLDIYPDIPEFLKVKGWGKYKQGKYNEASQLLEKAKENSLSFDFELNQMIQEVKDALARGSSTP